MLKQSIYRITENKKLTDSVMIMVLEGDTSAITTPGQFLNIKLDSLFLRRPISVCDWDSNSVTIIYKCVGKGTSTLSEMKKGDSLDILTGLGNGFDISLSGNVPLLIGGGVGTPPMLALTKKLLEKGVTPTVITGFNVADEVFLTEQLKDLGVKVIVTTVDGSVGQKGFVTDVVKQLKDYSYYYACGPEPMLKAVHSTATGDGELSFEERMGCGFGACMGCSCQTIHGYKRICREGPVLKKGEILW